MYSPEIPNVPCSFNRNPGNIPLFPHRSLPLLLATACGLGSPFLCSFATGAEAPPPARSGDPVAGQSTVQLSPFVVDAKSDQGYAATNTLEGSRLNTALRDTPAAISIFTKDLIDDLAATSLDELLRYNLHAELNYGDSQVGLAFGNESRVLGSAVQFRVRGLTGSTSTDGFRTGGSERNTFDVERVASTRGPNAILFGAGSAGGNLNFSTKSATLSRDSTSIDTKTGGDSTKRALVDLSRVLVKDKLALRMITVWDRKGASGPHKYTDFKGLTFSGKWRVSGDTDVAVTYRRSHTQGVSGRDWNHSDSISRFLEQFKAGQIRWSPAGERYENANGTALVNATAGIGNLAPRNVIVYGPDLTVPPQFWEGATSAVNRTTLTTNAAIINGGVNVDESIEPYGSVTPSGAGEFSNVGSDGLSVIINHRWFSSLYMELGYNHSRRRSDNTLGQTPELRADLNYRLPDGSLNPYFFGNGYYFSELNYTRMTTGEENDTFRASLSYDLNLGKIFGRHRFAASSERYLNPNRSWRTREVWANRPFGGAPPAAANVVTRRRYFKIDGPFANYTSGYQPGNVFNLEPFRSSLSNIGALKTDWVATNLNSWDDEVTIDSNMFVMQNHLFADRLVTTLGVRRDTSISTGPRMLTDAVTGLGRFATAADNAVFTPNGDQWLDRDERHGYRHSLGAVLHLTKNFSLTANFSKGIQLANRNRTVLPDGLTPPPVEGKGRDLGLSFSFLENRISGSIKFYQSTSHGERTQGGVGPIYVTPNNDIMSTFEYYFRQAGITTLGPTDPVQNIGDLTTVYTAEASAYLADQVSHGEEFEVVANPTNNWTLRAAFSTTHRTTTNVLFEAQGFWADRLAFWKSLDAVYMARTRLPSVFNQPTYFSTSSFGPTTPTQVIAQSAIDLANLRRQQEQAYGNRPYSANLWTRYSFNSGRLKGLAIGGGWRYQAANVAGVDFSTETEILGNPRSMGDLFVHYKTKGLGPFFPTARTTYQLNITNVFDDRTIVSTTMGVDAITKKSFFRRSFREDPRIAAFSLRLDF